MKTIIELPDDLREYGKAMARRENSTLKALIEEGLHRALQARTRKHAAPFAVRPFQGGGQAPECAGAGRRPRAPTRRADNDGRADRTAAGAGNSARLRNRDYGTAFLRQEERAGVQVRSPAAKTGVEP